MGEGSGGKDEVVAIAVDSERICGRVGLVVGIWTDLSKNNGLELVIEALESKFEMDISGPSSLPLHKGGGVLEGPRVSRCATTEGIDAVDECFTHTIVLWMNLSKLEII